MDFDESHKAIKKGDVIRIRHFLQSGGDANLANRLCWTLLMMAALEGNTAIGEELIQRGVQLDIRRIATQVGSIFGRTLIWFCTTTT
jgi:ankyrin repeat protein